jgi:hypothetical protein
MEEEKNSVNRRKSRFASGGTTEVSDGRLEWWERNVFSSSPTDMVYVVERKFVGRIDQIAAVFLGDGTLWWLLAQYNSILDPFSEIVEGAQIFIPSRERVSAMLEGRTGGVPSTREVPTTILPIV